MNLIKQIEQILFESYSPIYYILMIIGSATLLFYLYQYFSAISKKIFRRQIGLQQKYGKNKWALISNFSQGLSKKFAFKFAQQGFNIILLAASKNQFQCQQESLIRFNPNIAIKTVLVDFSAEAYIQNIQETIDQLKRYQISIVVNQVGGDMVSDELYQDRSYNDLISLINENCFAPNVLNYIFAKVLQERQKRTKQRGAIINIGSLTGQIPSCWSNISSASLKYLNHLSENLSQQYPSIDWLSLRPGQMFSYRQNSNKEPLEQTNFQCLRGALQDIEKDTSSNGSLIYAFENHLFTETLNIQVLNFFMSKLAVYLKRQQTVAA